MKKEEKNQNLKRMPQGTCYNGHNRARKRREKTEVLVKEIALLYEKMKKDSETLQEKIETVFKINGISQF